MLHGFLVLSFGEAGRKTRTADEQCVNHQRIAILLHNYLVARALLGGTRLGHVHQVLDILGIILFVGWPRPHLDFGKRRARVRYRQHRYDNCIDFHHVPISWARIAIGKFDLYY